jgi:hypothetical protein
MDLTKHEKRQIPPGLHTVKVTATKDDFSAKGTKFLQVSVVNAERETLEIKLYLTEKSFWRLAEFARAAGLTDEQMTNFSYDLLHGRKLQALIVKNDNGYPEAKEFFKADAKVEVPPPPAPAAAETEDDLPF